MPQVEGRILQGPVEALQARADGERGNRGDVGELAQDHQRQAGPQKIRLDAEQVATQLRQAARKTPGSKCRESPGNDQRG